MAGLAPAALMALALIGAVILLGGNARLPNESRLSRVSLVQLWRGAIVTLGLLVIIFVGFRFGVATATEISAFAALYALVVGGLAFRELGPRAAARSFINAATRSGLVLFIVAAAQALAFVLTLQQVPQTLAQTMIGLSQNAGAWPFMVLSILILIVMGSILEGAAALIIFGPLLMPVAAQVGINGLHFGVVLVIAMGIGLFAPPLGLGLYGACLIGGVPIETTIRPMLGYLSLLLLCLLVIAFVPDLTLWLPHRLGYQ
jgi:tripartite ATP-independent transporter DctM subunit